MNTFYQNLKLYIIFIGWLLRDALWRNRWKAATIIGVGVLGVALQGATLGLVIFYARHFSDGKAIHFYGQVIDTRTSISLLIMGSLIVVILLFLSAICIYFSRRNILQMGREYEEFCAKRIFEILGCAADVLSLPGYSSAGDPILFRLVKSDSRFAGRILRMLLSLVVPATTLLFAIAVLVHLEVGLSILIASLGLVLFYFQYRVSREGAQHSIAFEALAPSASSEYKSLIQHCKYQHVNDQNCQRSENLFSRGPVKNQLDAYEGRLRAVENSRLVSGIFTAIVVGLIFMIMGGSIINEGSGWGRLLVYLGALRFAMVSMQNVFSIITSINRFYPQMRRYFTFVKSVTNQSSYHEPLLDEYELRVRNNSGIDILPESLPRLVVHRGMRLAVVSPMDLNRYTLTALCGSLFKNNPSAVHSILGASRYASLEHSCPPANSRQSLGLSRQATWDDLRCWFPDKDSWARLRKQLSMSLDNTISQKQWEKLTPRIKFILSLISARMDKCSWLFVQAEGLQQLEPNAARFYLGKFSDCVTIILYKKTIDDLCYFGEHAVAVTDGDKLLGVGSAEWFDSVRDLVAQRISRKVNAKKNMVGSALDDDDDFDE